MSEEENITLRIPVTDLDHTIGPSQASVVVVNYGDYESPDCLSRHRATQKVIDELVGSVRLVYRHFPLVKVHPNALRAAEAAEAAAAQNKFWEMHRRLYLHPGKLGDRHLRHHAHEIGLDMDRYDSEMASSTYADKILKDYYHSITNGITGAPTTFVNGVLYSMTGDNLIAAVRAILNKS
jgi:protein-disulfide isomerase